MRNILEQCGSAGAASGKRVSELSLAQGKQEKTKPCGFS